MFEKELHKFPGLENQVWFVVFCDSDQVPRPFYWLTKPGFRHCLCLAESPAGTIMLNYTWYNCDIRFSFAEKASTMAFAFVNEGCKVLQVTTDKNAKFCLRFFIYCVPLVKCFLGLRGCFAFTPFGLYKWLKRSKLDVIDLNELTEKCDGRKTEKHD